ncbi:MAG: hypothetical protein JO258_00955 [Alphaproteobacteria bacterium]|nr:hypothetical protein [Alphaproteobacteria bacterium]
MTKQREQPSSPILEGRTAVCAAFLILLVLVSAPLFSTVLPPLVDYPNHLARLDLIAQGGNAFYAVRWAPLADLAADFAVPALALAMPLDLAAKLFLVLSFALIAGGIAWLNRIAWGAWRPWPLLGFLLLYNRTFLWGFINYLFGVGVALCGIALWLALEKRPRLRLLLSIPVALLCFFSHLAAFGVYALAVAGTEMLPLAALLRAKQWRQAAWRSATITAPFVLPAIVLFGFALTAPHGAVSFGAVWRKADLLFSVFDNYSRPFDVVCFALFAGLLAALALTRRLAVAPRLGAACAMLFAAYLLLPNQMVGGFGADHRLPPALFAVLIAMSAPVLPRRAALLLGGAAAAMLLLRVAAIEVAWRRADAIYAADLAAIDALPSGARLAVAYPPREVNGGGIPVLHTAALAASRRAAFVPILFADETQQPLRLRPPFDALAAATSPTAIWAAFVDGDAATGREISPVLRQYDFVVFAHRKPFAVAPRDCLRRAPSPPNFQLFAIDRDRACF